MAPRTKRHETVEKYLEAYLKDKSPEKREAFLAKSFDKQYACIMAWKNRYGNLAKNVGVSPADIIKHTRSITDLIDLAEDFSDKELKKMYDAVEAVREKLDGYQQIRKERELRRLEKEREAIQRKIDALTK